MDKSRSFVLSVVGVLQLLVVFKTYLRNERQANGEYKRGIARCVREVDTVLSVVVPPLVSVVYLVSSALQWKVVVEYSEANS